MNKSHVKTEKRTHRDTEASELRQKLGRYASWIRHHGSGRPREVAGWRRKAEQAFRGLSTLGLRATAEIIWGTHQLGPHPAMPGGAK